MILVDTSIWIEYFRGRNKAVVTDVNRLIDDYALCIAVPIRIELLVGVRGSEAKTLEGLLDNIPTFYPTADTWLEIERFVLSTKKRGWVFGMSDLLIAALAQAHDIPIWSLDSDFDRMAKAQWISKFERSSYFP